MKTPQSLRRWFEALSSVQHSLIKRMRILRSDGVGGEDGVAGETRVGFQQFVNGGSCGQLVKDLLEGDAGVL